MRLKQLCLVLLFTQAPIVFAENGHPPNHFPVGTASVLSYQLALENEIRNMPNNPPRAIGKSYWGAFAIDKKKLLVTDKEIKFVGVSSQQTTMKLAEKVALDMCKSDGGTNCEIMTVLPNKCLSIAISPKANALEFFFGNDLISARKIALLQCKIKHGEDCKPAHSVCSERDL